MTFDELVANVITITNHPELLAETQLAVRSATLQLHRRDYFYKDLMETALVFSTTDYLQTVDYRSVFPQYRSLKYLRKFDGTPTGVGAFLDIIQPEQVLDSYGLALVNVAYVAGTVIQIKSDSLMTYALIGVYLNPVVATSATYNSWVANEAPYAIIYTAAASILNMFLGDSTRGGQAAQLAALEIAEFTNSNILAYGS